MSMNDTDPSILFGGTWEQIKDKFLLSAGDSYAGGTAGGAKSVSYTPKGSNTGTSLSVAQMPAHTHTRGSMDITGNFPASLEGSGTFHTTGAFALASEKKYFGWGQQGTDYDNYGINFTASRNWTGATSSVGSGQSHTHTFNGTTATINTMPPYLVVYIWKRIG